MSKTMTRLAMPFPENLIHKNPSGGGHYVKHHVVEQRLIHVLGYPPDFERVEILFGDVAEIPPNPSGKSDRAKKGSPALKNVVVAVVARMTVEIDGRKIVAEEAGDCEEPHNWKTDGQRLKDAMSDAYKRCAMRLGVGLHLWSQDEYYLYDKLKSAESAPSTESPSNPQAEPTAEGDVPKASSSAAPQTVGAK